MVEQFSGPNTVDRARNATKSAGKTGIPKRQTSKQEEERSKAEVPRKGGSMILLLLRMNCSSTDSVSPTSVAEW
jgi:hypothetical protein